MSDLLNFEVAQKYTKLEPQFDWTSVRLYADGGAAVH